MRGWPKRAMSLSAEDNRFIRSYSVNRMPNSLSFSLSSSTAPSIQAVLDQAGLAATFRLTPLMHDLLESGGAASLATVSEVMEPALQAALKMAELSPDLFGDRAAHFKTMRGVMTIIDATNHDHGRRRWEFMRNPAVGKLVAENRAWRPAAYVAAAAIGARCMIVGNSRFFRRLAEHVVIPGGVRHPISGEWLVPPRI